MCRARTNARRARYFRDLYLVLALAGCTAAPPPETAAPPAPPAPVVKEPEIVETRPLEAPPRPPRPPRAAPAKPKPQIVAVAPPRKPVNDDPKQLFGLDGHRVAGLLGPANFVRRDGPAEVWQYRAEACVLDVYLYKDGGVLTVAHIDLRKREQAPHRPRQCFQALLARQR